MPEALAPKQPPTIIEPDPPGLLTVLRGPSLQGVMVGGYRLEKEISRGHTNEVYLAIHPILGTRAAVKILSSSRADLVERFIVEARLAAALRHPHIVQVYDLVSLADGR